MCSLLVKVVYSRGSSARPGDRFVRLRRIYNCLIVRCQYIHFNTSGRVEPESLSYQACTLPSRAFLMLRLLS